jgi:hypothetical protein
LEYIELVREQLRLRERELAGMRLAGEARRLGLSPRGPLAALDQWIIRAGDGARSRQERRNFNTGDHQSFA